MESGNPFAGTLTGGNSYLAEIWLVAKYGYTFAEDSEVTVNGATLVATDYDGDFFGVYASVPVAHVPGAAQRENEVPATCAAPGSHDEVVKCTACGEEVSRTQVEDPINPEAHNWGDWKVTTEPGETTAGEKTRVCANDASHVQREAIPPTGECTITFDLNGGTLNGSTDPVEVKAKGGEEITILAAPTREGYTFLYWEGSQYYPGDKYTVMGDHTLTAKWKANETPAPTPASGSKKSTSPATGDALPIVPIVVVALVAVACLGVAAYKRRA